MMKTGQKIKDRTAEIREFRRSLGELISSPPFGQRRMATKITKPTRANNASRN